MEINWTTLGIGLLVVLFCISVYYLGIFQTTIHTTIIVAITLIVLKLKGDL